MIVDLHTRIWDSTQQLGEGVSEQLRRLRREPWGTHDGSAEAHGQAMGPVHHAVILGFESDYLDAHITHEQVARCVAADPDKFIGFAGIDPTTGNPLESLERAVDLGLVGVAVSPATQGFHPADTTAMELYEACEARGMPIFVESGSDIARQAKMEFAQPYLIDEVARAFPNLKIVVSSLGHPFVDQGLALIGKHPTVYADVADMIHRPWQLYTTLVQAHQQGCIDQLVFGSNFPFCTPERAIVTIYSVNTMTHGTNLPAVPREALRGFVERDVMTCLGLRDLLDDAQARAEARASEQAAAQALTVAQPPPPANEQPATNADRTRAVDPTTDPQSGHADQATKAGKPEPTDTTDKPAARASTEADPVVARKPKPKRRRFSLKRTADDQAEAEAKSQIKPEAKPGAGDQAGPADAAGDDNAQADAPPTASPAGRELTTQEARP